MIVTIHQPEYLPWLGFFDKAAQADQLVLLDNVQYRHKYFQNRNRIRTHDGQCWINVPVLIKGYDQPLIKDIRINGLQPRWSERCWRSIGLNYRKARFFKDYAEFFEGVYSRPWDLLVDLNLELIRYLCRELGITASLVRASELSVSGTGPSLILDIVRKTEADVYISGTSGIAGRGKDGEEAFRRAGVEVRYQEFHHPIYRQLYEPFVPCMSAIDLLFNYGPDSPEVMKGIGVKTLEKVFA